MSHNKPTFKIESLLDKEGEYVGIFCAKTGQLLRHEGSLVEQKQEESEKVEEKEVIEDKNQMKLF